MNIHRIIFVTLIVVFGLECPACKKATEPTEPISQNVTEQLEIIPVSQVPNANDSSLFYMRAFTDWNSTTFHDTLRADSLASSFAQLKYNLTDLWFPNEGPICSRPFNTYNLVYLKLSSPDSAVVNLGFEKISGDFSYCFPEWRHYKYTRQ